MHKENKALQHQCLWDAGMVALSDTDTLPGCLQGTEWVLVTSSNRGLAADCILSGDAAALCCPTCRACTTMHANYIPRYRTVHGPLTGRVHMPYGGALHAWQGAYLNGHSWCSCVCRGCACLGLYLCHTEFNPVQSWQLECMQHVHPLVIGLVPSSPIHLLLWTAMDVPLFVAQAWQSLDSYALVSNIPYVHCRRARPLCMWLQPWLLMSGQVYPKHVLSLSAGEVTGLMSSFGVPLCFVYHSARPPGMNQI